MTPSASGGAPPGTLAGDRPSIPRHRAFPPDGRRTTVPVHVGNDIRPGTLRNILRDTSRTVDGLRRLRVPGDAHAPWGSASLIVDRRPPTGIAAADAVLLMLNHPLWVKPDRSGET